MQEKMHIKFHTVVSEVSSCVGYCTCIVLYCIVLELEAKNIAILPNNSSIRAELYNTLYIFRLCPYVARLKTLFCLQGWTLKKCGSEEKLLWMLMLKKNI